MGRNLLIFILALALVFAVVYAWPTQAAPANADDVETKTSDQQAEEPLSDWLLQLEGDWHNYVQEAPGLTTTEGIAFIEAGRLSGTWNGKRWEHKFAGGSTLNFRSEELGLYVDISKDGVTETVTLAE